MAQESSVTAALNRSPCGARDQSSRCVASHLDALSPCCGSSPAPTDTQLGHPSVTRFAKGGSVACGVEMVLYLYRVYINVKTCPSKELDLFIFLNETV